MSNGIKKHPVSFFFMPGLVILSALLFTLSFPSPLFKSGLPFLAWIAYVPVIVAVSKSGMFASIGLGAFFGLLSYALFNYWLGTFHPLAGVFVYSLYLFYMAIVFFFFKLACNFFPNKAYIVQWLVWLAYEYLRTWGFLGYAYGITGYSQWQFIPLIQIASLTGVWGVSALVTFPSFWLANVLRDKGLSSAINIVKKEKIPAIIWAAAVTACIVFGFAANKDFSSYPHAQITLIQHNTDPWEAARAPTDWQRQELYRKDMNALIRLSEEALKDNPDTQLVVWPETAFIPRIHWHSTYRDNQESWLIVKDLLEYLAAKDTPFLIGNDDGRKDPAKNPKESESYRIDYNASLLYENGVNTRLYRKLHLVPFTEHFPYKKQFPFIYKALESVDTNFWEKGGEETVFKLENTPVPFSFSTPICFEDSFGYLSRNFVRRGADILINMTNDAWADSRASQYQHLGMSVFRAVENSRSVVRSAVTGQTCAIDPSGKITREIKPFTEAYLNARVPIVKKTAFYTLYGDYLGVFFVIAAILLLIFGAIRGRINRGNR